MKYFGQSESVILAECVNCGKVLKIKRTHVSETNSGYMINPPFNCKCGQYCCDIKGKPSSDYIPPDDNSVMSESIQVCKLCGEKITDENEQFKMFAEVGPMQYWHKECAEKEGFDTTNQSSGWLSKEKINNYKFNEEEHKGSNNSNIIKNLIMTLIFIFLLGGCVQMCNNSAPEPKNFEDMTNKEMQQFLEWQIKEDQKQWENEKFFN